MTQRTIPRMIKIARAEIGNDSESEVNTAWTGNFNAVQLQLLAEKMPGMSIGFLTSGIAKETNVNPSLRATLRVVQNLNSTFNTSYSGLGENFMEAAKHRGVTFWPWTFRNQDLFVNYIDQENAEVEIEKTPRLKESILVKTSVSIKGEGLKNNVVIISPIKEDAVVNLNGERVQQVIIDNSNIKEIRGAENVRKWTVQDGVDVTELKVYSSSGEEIEI